MRLWRLELIPWCVVAGILPLLSNRLGVPWPVLLLVGFCLVAMAALFGELLHLRNTPTDDEAFDDRPADGLVPIVETAGISRSINSLLPAIGPFDKLNSDHSSDIRVRNGGKRLRGRVGLAAFFVGRDENAWDEREIVETYKSIERAGVWLEREAQRSNVPLNLERLATYFVANDEHTETVELVDSLDPFENIIDERDADLKALTSATRAAAALGFEHLDAMIEMIGRLADHDVLIFIVCLMRAGRSSAILPGQFGLPGDGVIVCYAREENYSEPLVGLPFIDPVTIAHELLHQFGATDKYGTSLKTFPERTVTRNDVMRLDVERLSKLRIDPLTAAEIGWSRGNPSNASG